MAMVGQQWLRWTTLTTASTAAFVFLPTTSWRRVGSLAKGRAWCEIQGLSGTGTSVAPAIQLSNSVDDLSSAGSVNLMAAVTGDGVKDPDTGGLKTVTNASDYKYYRLGWNIKVTSGVGSVRAAGRVQLFDE